MSEALTRLGVAECTAGGSHCRCVENAALTRAYEIGVQHSMLRATQIERVLTDLIAELRELATCDIDLGNQTDPETIAFLLDRAEARLKGLNDE